jgi:predicted DCC family thiol-disulfide oxidoreductase YuxK
MTRSTIIYDGACGLCRHSVDWIRARDRDGAFEYLPYQSEELVVRFPGVTRAACERALHLVTGDGSVLVGADALPVILVRLPGWKIFAPLLAWRPLQPLSRRLYGRIARARRGSGTAQPEDASPQCGLRP